MNKPTIQIGRVPQILLLLTILMDFLYISWWMDPRHYGYSFLYILLVLGELYHLFMSLSFIYTVWPRSNSVGANGYLPLRYTPSVDIFIPVAGEPKEVIYQTARAAKAIVYPKSTVYILNDGFVAKKDNWQEAEEIAKALGIRCITRKLPGGAKAGNINHALEKTHGECIALFDADMVPHPDFLQKTMPYLANHRIAFVQTPQYYSNHDENAVTLSAWEQQEFFFGAIMKGKDTVDAAFICGTNVVIRREAIEDIGGFYDKSVTEDFLTSLFIHQKGWLSHYVPEVVAEGLAPADLGSYYKQQTRWAKGTVEVVFRQNPLAKKRLSLGQKIQYLTSSFYYFNGVIVFIDMMMPLLFFYFGLEAVKGDTVSFAIFFIPYMVLNLYAPYLASKATLSYRALAFSHSSWSLQLSALRSVLLKEKSTFTITPKSAQKGRYVRLVIPHIAYVVLGIAGSIFALYHTGFTSSVATNVAWAVFNMSMFLPFITAAFTQYE